MHVDLEGSANEADLWTSWMLAVTDLIAGGTMMLRVRNQTGGTLVKGTLVYVSGYSVAQGRFLISKADADTLTTPALFVLDADLTDVTNGVAYRDVDVTALDTSAFGAVGDKVYLSATAGAFTPTAPAAAHKLVIGIVTAKDAATGSIRFLLSKLWHESLAATNVAQTWNAAQLFNYGQFKLNDVSDNHKVLVQPSEEAADRTLTIPVLGGDKTLACIDLAQTFSAIQTFQHGMLKLRDTANDHSLLLQAGADEAADRIITIPALGGDKTLALINLAQTFSAAQAFNASVVIGATAPVTGTNVLKLELGTAHTPVADAASCWVADRAVGDARWNFKGEGSGNPVIIGNGYVTVDKILTALSGGGATLANLAGSGILSGERGVGIGYDISADYGFLGCVNTGTAWKAMTYYCGEHTFYLGGSGNKILELTSGGNTVVGNQAALATTATDGFLYVPSCAGVPTGVPTAYTGKIAIVADSTNNRLYIYSGGAWVALN